MNFLVVVTESHRPMYEHFFLKSRPSDLVVLRKELSSRGDGEYLSPCWQEGVTGKLRWALEYVSREPDSIFAVTDVDLQFFPRFQVEDLRDEFERSGADVLFQREVLREAPDIEVNTGFYVARGTPYVVELLRKAIGWCECAASPNDQVAINSLLQRADFGRRWGVLSSRYYARSHGFPPPRDICVHHANNSRTVTDKIRQLSQIRRFVLGGPADRWSVLIAEASAYAFSGRLPGMVWRKLHQRRGML